MNHHIQYLIEETRHRLAVLEDSEQRFSRELAPKFRLFEPFRVDELTLSRCIGGLLDPNGAHGQGPVYLDAFLEEANIQFPKTSTKNARVTLERITSDGRRIDLLIELGSQVTAIENKPWADDQPSQLEDYSDYLKDFPGTDEWRLIYLANNGPGDKSISLKKRDEYHENKNLILFDFHRLETFLANIAPYARQPTVRVYVEELAKLIRYRINGEIDMNKTTEVEKLIGGNSGYTRSAMSIRQAWQEIRLKRLKAFKDQLEAAWLQRTHSKPGTRLNWSDKIESERRHAWCGFVEHGEQVFMPCFEFGQAGLGQLYWGVSTVSRTYPDEQRRAAEEIARLMNEEFRIPGQSNHYWPWYVYAGREPVTEDYSDWQQSPRPWVEMETDELARKAIALVERIYSILQEQPALLRGELT